jgi:MmyB-like transcription regulator ligand binding domain
LRPAVQQILDAMSGAAAIVANDRLDILGTNELGRALFADVLNSPRAQPPNTARFIFLDPLAQQFYGDWDRAARETAATLRLAAGRDPHDAALVELIGELSTQSEAFRTHWATHNVRLHSSGRKPLHHRDVGDLELNWERLDLAADQGLTIVVYSAYPGSRDAEALALLGTLAATAQSQSNQPA